MEHVLRCTRSGDAYFWATHGRAELDLLIFVRGKRWGVEFKFQDAPAMTKSMRIAIEDLRLDRLRVIYPGERRYHLGEKVEAVPLTAYEAAASR